MDELVPDVQTKNKVPRSDVDVLRTYREAIAKSLFDPEIFVIGHSGLSPGVYEEVWLKVDTSKFFRDEVIFQHGGQSYPEEIVYGVQVWLDGERQWFRVAEDAVPAVLSTSYEEVHDYIVANLDRDLLKVLAYFIEDCGDVFEGWGEQFKHIIPRVRAVES